MAIVRLSSDADRFDVRLCCVDDGAGLGVRIEYNPSRYDAIDIEYLRDGLGVLIDAVRSDARRPIARLPVIGAAERARLADVSCGSDSVPASQECLHQLFEAQAARIPDRIALEQGNDRFTYRDIDRQANRLARALRERGAQPESIVGVMLHRSPNAIVALLAVLKAGAAYLPIDPETPAARRDVMLADAGAIVLIADGSHSPWEGTTLAPDDPSIEGLSPEPLDVPVHPDNLVYTLHTSGSTGAPKGVMVSHRALANYLTWAVRHYRLAEGDGAILHTSFCFDLTVTSLWGPLIAGQKIVLAGGGHGIEPLLDLLRRGANYSLLKLTPSHLAMLNQALRPEEMRGLVRTLVIGGEELRRDVVGLWLEHAPETGVYNEYGPTETVVGSTVADVRSFAAQGATVPIGYPIANTRVHLVDHLCEPVPFGARGEICIGGAGVARGYLHRPADTASSFIAMSAGGGKVWYRTGDLGRLRRDGALEFAGRRDHQIKLHGYRIEPGEVERALLRHPAIRDAVVVLREDASGARVLAAFVVPADGREIPDQRTMNNFLAGILPGYAMPGYIVPLPELPRMVSGKIDRAALPLLDSPAHGTTGPRDIEEVVLARIWRDVLGLDGIGIDDDYFLLGGDSIRSIAICARTREAGIRISVAELFEHPTIRELIRLHRQSPRTESTADRLGPFGLLTADDAAGVPAGIEDAYPVTMLQGGMIFHNEIGGDASVYHDIFSYRLLSVFDAACFRTAVEALVARHPALRTTFDLVCFSEPMQLVHASSPDPLGIDDLQGLADDVQDREIARWIEEEKSRGFDPARLPLVRFHVHVRSRDSFQFTLSFHHAVIDGWSDVSMLTELFTHYLHLQRGEPYAVETPATHYREFVRLEREAVASDECARFWDEALHDGTFAALPRHCDEPTDEKRIVAQRVEISAELSEQLKRTALALSLPVKSVLLAAHMRVMALLTGETDVVSSAVFTGRPESADAERTLGLFINSLPIRCELAGGTWRQLADNLFELERTIMPYRRYPLAELKRRRGGGPISETLFYFTNYHVVEGVRSLGGIELVDLIPHEVSSFTLAANFSVDPFTSGVNLTLACDEAQIGHEQAIAVGGYYLRALEAIAADPEAAYDDWSPFPAAELDNLPWRWNGSREDFPLRSIVAQFESQVARTPDAEAIVFEDRCSTYRELNERADAFARALYGAGVRRGDRAGIHMFRSIDLVAGMLGILKAGAAYVPLDPALPDARLRFMIEDALVQVVVVDDEADTARLGDGPAFVRLGPAPAWEAPAEPPFASADIDDPAYLLYTSGSTGAPKGVMVSHRNVASFFAGMDRSIAGDAPGVWLALTNVAFDISVLELLWTLTRGWKVVMQGEPDTYFPAEDVASAGTSAIDFSLFYFAAGDGGEDVQKYRLLMEGATFADRHGFAAIWTPERHFHEFGGLYPNPAVTSAAIAAITQRIGIRAGSVVLPLHNPIRVAEEWSMVDNLSGGRVGLSFASGWHRSDFVLAPGKYADRRRIMFDDIATVRALWRGDALPADDAAGGSVRIRPRPVQADLPIWISSAGDPDTFRTAGELGAGVLTHLLNQDIPELAGKIALYREAVRGNGNRGAGHVAVMLHTFVGDDDAAVRALVREPLMAYLRSSADLARGVIAGLGVETSLLHAEEIEPLLQRAFDRYVESRGLIGSLAHCAERVEQLRAIGVDEIACLIDFGVGTDTVIESLAALDELRRRCTPRRRPRHYGARRRDNEPGRSANTEPGGRWPIASQIEMHGVTHMQCTPTLVSMLLADAASCGALARLHALLLGGEPLSDGLAVRIGRAMQGTILNMYGPTETTIWSTVAMVQPGLPVTIGEPIANTHLYILDRFMKPVPVGTPGELCIGGDGVAIGYAARAAETAASFLPDPFGGRAGGRIYRTGDRVRRLADGSLRFLGRRDGQIKIGGQRIETGEIEAEIARHEEIADCVVQPFDADRLVAYVVLPTEAAFDSARLRRSLAERLPGVMIPARFIQLETLPRTPNGKLDRAALRCRRPTCRIREPTVTMFPRATDWRRRSPRSGAP
ncbi:MAG TPA: amino acid adenylation domain-containing protein [Candidatus Kapabacteria bacterium]|nr:amino acid adenylation domain-containing protein [Candidatus Kapabacteria bacterium]